jgi:hypothetical protein
MLQLLDALRDVSGMCKAELPEVELRVVIEAHHAVEDALKSGGRSC